MQLNKVEEILAHNHESVFTTFRRNGAVQMSIVTVGVLNNGVAFMVHRHHHITMTGQGNGKKCALHPHPTLAMRKEDQGKRTTKISRFRMAQSGSL